MDPLQKSIGTQIRQFRKTRRLTIEELAHLSGLDSTHFSKIERGEINLSVGTLEKILTALALTPSAFFDFDAPIPPTENPIIENTASVMKFMTVEEQKNLYQTATLFYQKRDRHE